jgi:mRNA interferase HigB
MTCAVRVISPKRLREFSTRYPEATAPLKAWSKLVRKNRFGGIADLKRTFQTVDSVSIKRGTRRINYFVFNIGGNKYRLVAAIHFNSQMLFVRDVLTHRVYDLEKWKR